jgi:hypothetical protein
MSRENIDPAELREDIETIKQAMGIGERYEGATELWLFFGVLVAVAAGASQYAFLADLPGYVTGGIWIAFGGTALLASRRVDVTGASTTGATPDLFFQIAVVYLASFPLLTVVYAYTDVQGTARSVLPLSVVLVLLGCAYAVVGNSLKAYRIRRRDRYAFYAGTVWMVALATALPFVDLLETWHYAAFGTAYLVYALATYLVLVRS